MCSFRLLEVRRRKSLAVTVGLLSLLAGSKLKAFPSKMVFLENFWAMLCGKAGRVSFCPKKYISGVKN